ncbi:hypothetical protein GCM10011607_28620 [Shewanella inventionis]|uniref:Uncharacterized protein n=1 Tax=Shewanella inventionis TaxID=1738770 RepID=A0ABQ1JDJ0_9GAMM|nr:hypothetical protein [Shewanella inventionis]GGB66216.1 hypothetical protein GCM10011607_28620 [Shewanella inventionis]
MAIAKHVVRYRTSDYNVKDIVKLSEQWGEFVFRTPHGICFAGERYEATQEYLIKKHKIKNGYLIIQLGDHTFEVNKVVEHFIEETTTISTLAVPFAIALNQAVGDISGNSIVLRVDANTEINPSNEHFIIDSDGDEVPAKYEYSLAVIAAKQSFGNTKAILIAGVVIAGLTYGYAYDFFFEKEVAQVSEQKIDPFEGFFAAINGGEPDVRQTMLATYRMMEVIDTIPQWRGMNISINKSGGGVVIAAELTPRIDGDNPQRTILVNTAAKYGYLTDLQQQNPVIFLSLRNTPIYDLENETAPFVNIDQSLAYLSDSVNSLVENGSITIPVEQLAPTGGDYKQKNLQITMTENYAQHLDYLSVIFSGWPVYLQSGRIEMMDRNKYRAQFNLTILGE